MTHREVFYAAINRFRAAHGAPPVEPLAEPRGLAYLFGRVDGAIPVVETRRGVRIALIGPATVVEVANYLAWVDSLPEVAR